MPRPARPWFRTYSESLENAKEHALGTTESLLFYRYHQLRCLANITEPRGYLPRDIIKVAYAMRTTAEEATEILSQLRSRRFLDLKGGRLYIHNWHEWNPDSDANLTKARATRNLRTPKERVKNAERTPLERLDSDKEEDKDKEEEQEQETDRVKPQLPLAKVFNNLTGRAITPMEAEHLRALEEEHPYERIVYAIEQASLNGVRKIAYIKSICEAQETNGDNHDRPSTGTRVQASDGLSTAERAFLARTVPERTLVLD